MIFPTLPFFVEAVVGRDVYGQPTFGAPVKELCSAVRLDFRTQPTTVRTDSGASQGHANEDAHVVVILVRPKSKAVIGTRVDLLGYKLRVERSIVRYTAAGRLDHYQLELGPWA